jgi:hypothetical protein
MNFKIIITSVHTHSENILYSGANVILHTLNNRAKPERKVLWQYLANKVIFHKVKVYSCFIFLKAKGRFIYIKVFEMLKTCLTVHIFLTFLTMNILKVLLKLSIMLWLSIKRKKLNIKLTYSKLPDNAWILTHILQMEGNTMGCSWVLHHVQNPTLTSTRCFILRSLDIHDVEIGHENLVSTSSPLLVRAIAISKFKPSFITLPLKSPTSSRHISWRFISKFLPSSSYHQSLSPPPS